MFVLGILSWPGLARLIRGQILSERERDYVLAAKALGIKEKHIIWRHIFPAVTSIVLVNLTLGYAGSLLTEAGLSFLGFGVQKPNPSWGNILNAAQDMKVFESYWWRWILPGLCIIVAALSINLIGDALRDAMDPKNMER
jgi:peptide/nickel transport system permease protein